MLRCLKNMFCSAVFLLFALSLCAAAPGENSFSEDVIEQVEIEIKYEGYIKKAFKEFIEHV